MESLNKKFRFKPAQLGIFSTHEADLTLKEFGRDCRILGLTRGQFSMIDLIHSILKKTGKANVICVTWSAGIKDVNQVRWMLDSELINDFKLITDHSYKTRQPQYAISIEELFGLENIRTSEIHAKFTLIYNNDYNVCIRTSMNLNANKTCENFEIDENKEIFDFYMQFIKHTFKDLQPGFTTESFKVNKSLDKFFHTQNNNLRAWSEL